MALVFPAFLPFTRISQFALECEPTESFVLEQGGRFISVRTMQPLWRMRLATTPSEKDFNKWRAFLDSLQHGGREFRGYDVRRPMPWNYRYSNGYEGLVRAGGSNPFAGTSQAASISADRQTVTNASGATVALPVGFQFEIGDYVSLWWVPPNQGNDRRSLHRIIEKPAAADSNGVTTIRVHPRVHVAVPSNSEMDFGLVFPGQISSRATCFMRLTSRDRSAEVKQRRISFEAVQSLRLV